VLISGANRGIGLELARQYAVDGWRVHATVRKSSSDADLKIVDGDVQIHSVDVTDDTETTSLAAALSGEPIDILWCNVGHGGDGSDGVEFGSIAADQWLDLFRVNTVATIMLIERLLDRVQMSDLKTIAVVSSRAGSISERGSLPYHRPGGNTAYRSSKAALNAAVKGLAFDLKDEGVRVFAIHPGRVRTRLGGQNADLDTATSVAGIRQVAEQPDKFPTGNFYNYDGSIISW